MNKEEFIQEGFTVVATENNENKLLCFLKENYPSIIKDNEIDLNELKAIAGLPIDEKVNGYGLSFVGRNFARGKYAQKTTKELKLNTSMSKNIDTTQNLLLKGDNLDSLKILKNHYTGKIKCIYIDPPYNTANDEFVYPDKFDKEETEVLGLVNLSDDDFARMDFSFRTKKSHNGWLSFMYPRLLLARDLLSDDGVIFISIDDNEQANLKLLCDEIFGEENTETYIWNLIDFEESSFTKTASNTVRKEHEYIISVFKNKKKLNKYNEERLKNREDLSNIDNDSRGPWFSGNISRNGIKTTTGSKYFTIKSPQGVEYTRNWTISKEEYEDLLADNRIYFSKNGSGVPRLKKFQNEVSSSIQSSIFTGFKTSITGKNELKYLFENQILFDFPKPTTLIKRLLEVGSNPDSIILDFFAGSGTTGQAVMQLNAEDGGKRKFILCQIDEPIKEDKPAYKFCKDNNLPPVISSITIERLKRAGEKIAKEIEIQNAQPCLLGKDIKQVPDIGFKVFDSVEAPKLELDESGQISILFNDNDTLSRIYNMIFTVGLDEPTQIPEEVVKDCIYKIGNHYYITNSEKVKKDDFAETIKNGKVFIDGWTASLNGTLQNYKEDVKIVF